MVGTCVDGWPMSWQNGVLGNWLSLNPEAILKTAPKATGELRQEERDIKKAKNKGGKARYRGERA